MNRSYKKSISSIAAMASLAMIGAGAAQAATVELGFGNSPGSYSPYYEDGYNVSANSDGSGAVSLDNSSGKCPFSDPSCLHVSGSNPGTAFVEQASGANFDAYFLNIEFAGQGTPNYLTLDNGVDTVTMDIGQSYSNGVYLTADGSGAAYTGTIDFSTSYHINLSEFAVANGLSTDFFLDIPELSIETFEGGANVRIDQVGVSPVPVPAGGVLLLSALGLVGGLARRRRKATTA